MRDTFIRLALSAIGPITWVGEILSKRMDRDGHSRSWSCCSVGFWPEPDPFPSFSLARESGRYRRGRRARSASSGLAMALVVIVGGIDLSVGSMFALTDFCALYTLDVLNWPVAAGRRWRRSLCGAAARRGQRRADRLSAAARLHHHADHADRLSFRLRSFSFSPYSNEIAAVTSPTFPSWNFIGERRLAGCAKRRAGLCRWWRSSATSS